MAAQSLLLFPVWSTNGHKPPQMCGQMTDVWSRHWKHWADKTEGKLPEAIQVKIARDTCKVTVRRAVSSCGCRWWRCCENARCTQCARPRRTWRSNSWDSCDRRRQRAPCIAGRSTSEIPATPALQQHCFIHNPANVLYSWRREYNWVNWIQEGLQRGRWASKQAG